MFNKGLIGNSRPLNGTEAIFWDGDIGVRCGFRRGRMFSVFSKGPIIQFVGPFFQGKFNPVKEKLMHHEAATISYQPFGEHGPEDPTHLTIIEATILPLEKRFRTYVFRGTFRDVPYSLELAG